MNLVLQEATERIIRPVEEEVPSEEVPLGLYIIRGDSVAVVGRVDEEIDGKIDWSKVHGEVLGSTKHTWCGWYKREKKQRFRDPRIIETRDVQSGKEKWHKCG